MKEIKNQPDLCPSIAREHSVMFTDAGNKIEMTTGEIIKMHKTRYKNKNSNQICTKKTSDFKASMIK